MSVSVMKRPNHNSSRLHSQSLWDCYSAPDLIVPLFDSPIKNLHYRFVSISALIILTLHWDPGESSSMKARDSFVLKILMSVFYLDWRPLSYRLFVTHAHGISKFWIAASFVPLSPLLWSKLPLPLPLEKTWSLPPPPEKTQSFSMLKKLRPVCDRIAIYKINFSKVTAMMIISADNQLYGYSWVVASKRKNKKTPKRWLSTKRFSLKVSRWPWPTYRPLSAKLMLKLCRDQILLFYLY